MSSFLLLKSLDLLVKPLYPYSCWSNDCQKSHCCSSNPYVLLAKSSSGSVWMWFFPPKLAHFDREDVVFHRIKVDQSYSFACEITNLFCWLHPNNILVTNHLYFLLVTSPTFFVGYIPGNGEESYISSSCSRLLGSSRFEAGRIAAAHQMWLAAWLNRSNSWTPGDINLEKHIPSGELT